MATKKTDNKISNKKEIKTEILNKDLELSLNENKELLEVSIKENENEMEMEQNENKIEENFLDKIEDEKIENIITDNIINSITNWLLTDIIKNNDVIEDDNKTEYKLSEKELIELIKTVKKDSLLYKKLYNEVIERWLDKKVKN